MDQELSRPAAAPKSVGQRLVRWEMRPRMFLRTSEFLWQEGHTAHATSDEAQVETLRMLDIYASFAENCMAMPIIRGIKTQSEKFPGAVDTYCIEAMMQDRKALQAGTSHFLGQNFSRASNIQFLDKEGSRQHAWTTSWGVSTRLIGGLIMAHADDDGLVLPPHLAPAHVVILPVIRKAETAQQVIASCEALAAALKAQNYAGAPIRVSIDTRDARGGEKVWTWIKKKGVPIRVEIGPREIEADSVFVARRDGPATKQISMKRGEFVATIGGVLDEIQNNLLLRGRAYFNENTRLIDSFQELISFFTPARRGVDTESDEIHGGFALTRVAVDAETEAQLKSLGVTVRCIPLDRDDGPGPCVLTGRRPPRALFWRRHIGSVLP